MRYYTRCKKWDYGGQNCGVSLNLLILHDQNWLENPAVATRLVNLWLKGGGETQEGAYSWHRGQTCEVASLALRREGQTLSIGFEVLVTFWMSLVNFFQKVGSLTQWLIKSGLEMLMYLKISVQGIRSKVWPSLAWCATASFNMFGHISTISSCI